MSLIWEWGSSQYERFLLHLYEGEVRCDSCYKVHGECSKAIKCILMITHIIENHGLNTDVLTYSG
jgi:hypothetical protein